METWLKVIVLSVGGTLGVNARYWLGAWISRWTSSQFPWATFTINVSGSFLIGFLTVTLTRWIPHPSVRLLLITGFLGGFTTFSTFENDSLMLWERGESILMAANLFGSVGIGFAAVLLGASLARGLAEPAVQRAALTARRVERIIAEPPNATRNESDESIPASSDVADRVGPPRRTNEGSER